MTIKTPNFIKSLFNLNFPKIEPYGFGDTLYFIDSDYRTRKFKLVKGEIIKIRKEVITEYSGRETTKFSYKIMSKGDVSDYMGQDFVSNDVEDVLKKLNILGEVKEKYKMG